MTKSNWSPPQPPPLPEPDNPIRVRIGQALAAGRPLNWREFVGDDPKELHRIVFGVSRELLGMFSDHIAYRLENSSPKLTAVTHPTETP